MRGGCAEEPERRKHGYKKKTCVFSPGQAQFQEGEGKHKQNRSCNLEWVCRRQSWNPGTEYFRIGMGCQVRRAWLLSSNEAGK